MATNGHTNGTHAHRALTVGIYAPIPTFYIAETEDLDLPTFEQHVIRVAQAGVNPLVAGSMGEGIHLTHSERKLLIQSARKALDSIGLNHIPIVAGTGTGSTRETIELCKEAAEAGADYAIVITSGYFAGVLANNRKAIKAFFKEVAEKSPIPVMIYNYPGASGGIDIDSELITELAQESPNLCGVKLTCGNVGKLTRVANIVSDSSFTSQYPRLNPNAPFLVLGGFIDFLVPSAYVDAHGAITGLGNVAPHACAKLWQLASAARTDLSVLPEASRLQGIVARADFTVAKFGISGTKWLLEKLYGYGGVPRKPLPPIEPAAAEALWSHPDTVALIQVERELSGKVAA